MEVNGEVRGEVRFDVYMQSYPGAGFRSRVAWWLRRLAYRLDRVMAVGVVMESTPAIEPEERKRALILGLEHARDLYVEAARIKLMDALADTVVGDEQR